MSTLTHLRYFPIVDKTRAMRPRALVAKTCWENVQLYGDCVLEHFAKRRLEKVDLPVRLSLRIGLYQLRFLSRIPPSAAVNESVNLVRAAGLRSAASFTNAILRRAAREAE